MAEQKEVKGNLLSNISPPVALPSFVTGVLPAVEPVVESVPVSDCFLYFNQFSKTISTNLDRRTIYSNNIYSCNSSK